MSRRINTAAERLQGFSNENIVNRARRIVNDCVRLFDTDQLPGETKKYCILRLEELHRSIGRADSIFPTDALKKSFFDALEEILADFREAVTGSRGNLFLTFY